MGILRFFLAFLVLLSHTIVEWPNYFNPGMFSLPSFYMIGGYSMLPGTLFFFLIGSFLFDLPEKQSKWMPIISITAGAIILSVLFLTDVYKIAANFEMTSALLLGPLLVYLVKNFRHPIDDFMGNISYGLFLGHFIIIRCIHHFVPGLPNTTLLLIVFVLLVFLAIIGYQLVEKPAVVFRRKLRKY